MGLPGRSPGEHGDVGTARGHAVWRVWAATRRPARGRTLRVVLALALALLVGPVATAGAVVHGVDTPVGAFPWIVQVGEGDDAYCTGSLITARVVLTAAHCVGKDPPTAVVVGRQRVGGPGGSRVRVARTTFDERFVRAQRGDALASDIGLLELARPVTTAAPVALAGADAAPLLFPGRRPIMGGWGVTDTGTLEGDAGGTSLHTGAMPVRSSAWCVKAIDGADGRSHGVACAGHLKGGATGCYGDSGGPLFQTTPAGPVLLGVTSSITRAGCTGGSTLFIKVLPGTSARAYVDAHLTPNGALRADRRAPRGDVTRAIRAPITPLR